MPVHLSRVPAPLVALVAPPTPASRTSPQASFEPPPRPAGLASWKPSAAGLLRAALLTGGAAGCEHNGPIETSLWSLMNEVSGWGIAGVALLLSAVSVYATLRRQGYLGSASYTGLLSFYIRKRMGWRLAEHFIENMSRSPLRGNLNMPPSRMKDAESLCEAFYEGLGRFYVVTAPRGAGKSSFLAWFSDQILSGKISECDRKGTSVYRVALHRIPQVRDVKYSDRLMSHWNVLTKAINMESGRMGRRVVLLVDGLDTALGATTSDILMQVLQDLIQWTDNKRITMIGAMSTKLYERRMDESPLGRFATEIPLSPMAPEEVAPIARLFAEEMWALEPFTVVPEEAVQRALVLSAYPLIKKQRENPAAVKRILDRAQRASHRHAVRGERVDTLTMAMIEEAAAKEAGVSPEVIRSWKPDGS